MVSKVIGEGETILDEGKIVSEMDGYLQIIIPVLEEIFRAVKIGFKPDAIGRIGFKIPGIIAQPSLELQMGTTVLFLFSDQARFDIFIVEAVPAIVILVPDIGDSIFP